MVINSDTYFDSTNSVFKIIFENNSFSLIILDHWNSKSAEKPIGELNKLLELRPDNDIELHNEHVRKRD